MGTVNYTNDGLVFNIDIAENSGCIFDSARRSVLAYLNRLKAKGFLQNFHDHIENKPFDFDDAPCLVTINNGGYSD